MKAERIAALSLSAMAGVSLGAALLSGVSAYSHDHAAGQIQSIERLYEVQNNQEEAAKLHTPAENLEDGRNSQLSSAILELGTSALLGAGILYIVSDRRSQDIQPTQTVTTSEE